MSKNTNTTNQEQAAAQKEAARQEQAADREHIDCDELAFDAEHYADEDDMDMFFDEQDADPCCPSEEEFGANFVPLAEVLGMDPAAFQEVSAKELEPDEERPLLKDILQQALDEAKMQSGCESAGVGNALLAKHGSLIAPIAMQISSIAQPSGRLGEDGLANPAVLLSQDVKAGKYDDMTMDDYQAVLAVINDFARLWEGGQTRTDTALACNALLYNVLSDSTLAEMAFRRTSKWLGLIGQTIRPRA